jgi:transcriptional regulator with XRE-family HTH domain
MSRVSKVRAPSPVTAELSRAARGLLRWTQQHASVRIGIAITTLAEFEASEGGTRSGTVELIESVYRNAGVTFVNDADKVGVLMDRSRLGKNNPR